MAGSVACFAVYRFISHLILRKRIDKQGKTLIIDPLPLLQMGEYRVSIVRLATADGPLLTRNVELEGIPHISVLLTTGVQIVST